jgi:hypothetical protein
MPSIILHIGKEKTGTTFIQRQIALNANALFDAGLVDASNDFGSGDKCWLTVFGYNDDQNDDVARNLHLNQCSKFLRELKIREQKTNFQRFAVHHNRKTIVVSSEHFSSRLASINHLIRLREFLKPLFTQITVLLYLRDPLETAISLWSTALKSGSVTKELPDPSNPYYQRVCDHKGTIQMWGEVFGLESIQPRVYEFARDHRLGLIGDFVESCGFEVPDVLHANFIQIGHPNRRLPLIAQRVICRLNEKFRDLIDDPSFRRLRSVAVSNIESDCSGMPLFLPSQQIANRYNEYFAQSNKWVEDAFFAGKVSLPWGRVVGESFDKLESSDEKEDYLFQKYADLLSRNFPAFS